MTKLSKVWILALISLAASPRFLVASTVYVDANATGSTHDGSSWCEAYLYVQDALAAAAASGGSINEIRVGDGVYKPDRGVSQTPGDRDATFQLLNGVTIAGGYAGCGAPDPDQRDIAAYETILSGDLAGNDVAVPVEDLLDEPTRGENSYHVVTGSGTVQTATLDGCTIVGGNASQVSPDPRSFGGGMYSSNGDPTVTNSTFRINAATYGGGMCSHLRYPTVTNCTFTGNWADRSGGGMYNVYSSPTLTNCTLAENSANHGGGMLNAYKDPIVNDCIIDGNTAYVDGGGMYNYLSSPAVTNSSFSGNRSHFDGGGMYNASSNPTVTNSTFSGNSGDRNGGGMCNANSNPTVTDSMFSGNWTHWYGGGMFNENSSPTVIDCAFDGNSALIGGGMDNGYSSNPEVTNCTFSRNSAEFVAGGMYNLSNAPTVTNCTFHANSAAYVGGGMTNDHSDASVTNCTFSENSASKGGGMSNDFGETTVTNCRFSRNRVVFAGGGMYNFKAAPTVTNCMFSGNSAIGPSSEGGGMYNNQAAPTVTNCTFSGNTAGTGGGMYNEEDSTPTVTNCVLWGNAPDELVNLAPATDSPFVSYSVVQDGLPAGTIDGGGNIDADPLFLDANGPDDIPGTSDDNLRLMQNSPAIDAGDNAALGLIGIFVDLDGYDRFVDMVAVADTGNPGVPPGPIVDMGAFEARSDCNGNGVPDEFESDSDSDGAIDDCDGCPEDPFKTDPGVCGCGVSDTADADADGTPDCSDQCPDIDDGIFAPGCTDAIPTTSTWGLVILTLMLLIAAKHHFGRARKPCA